MKFKGPTERALWEHWAGSSLIELIKRDPLYSGSHGQNAAREADVLLEEWRERNQPEEYSTYIPIRKPGGSKDSDGSSKFVAKEWP